MTRNPLVGSVRLVSACAALGSSVLICAAGATAPGRSDHMKAAPTVKPAAPARLTEDQKIVHALNRLGYGPRPGDVERVRQIGLTQYVDLQLHPEKIDDSAADRKLASLTTLQLSADQLSSQYHDLMQSTRQMQAMRKKLNKQAAPGDPAQAEPATPATPPGARKRPVAMDPADRRAAREMRQSMSESATPVARAHEEFVAAKMLRAIDSERQLQEVLVDFWGNHFNIDIRKPPCGVLKILDDREVIRPHVFGKFRELLGASAKSPAMLVYLDNFQSMTEQPQGGPAGRMPPNRARRLQQLALDASAPPDYPAAKRAAMRLQRLQQLGTTAPGAAAGQTQPPVAPKRKRPSGLNENYAREIMELHTLGVDGGYTQQDVKEVARCLTGWTVASAEGRRPGAGKYAEAGSFRFNRAMHDDGQKTVLGHVIPAGGGEKDGELVLDILASHPATMNHISTQLCQRLVSDEPPASLVAKCVATWRRTDGDLREIVRTIVTSPEFFAPSSRASKIKSPFEYAVSSVRALDGSFNPAAGRAGAAGPRAAINLIKPPKGGGYLDMGTTSLVGQVGTMGEPLFQYQAPTGYPEDSRKWVSSGALISRLNFALALTDGKLSDVKLQTASVQAASDPNQTIDRCAARILHAPVTPATRATLVKQVQLASDSGGARTQPLSESRIDALLLGSPEFQRH